MSISRDSTDEQIASHIKAMNQQQESSDERQKDLAMIEHAGLKRSLGSFFMRKFVIGALCRECLRLRQEIKGLQVRVADKS
jgi:hypothetical protein